MWTFILSNDLVQQIDISEGYCYVVFTEERLYQFSYLQAVALHFQGVSFKAKVCSTCLEISKLHSKAKIQCFFFFFCFYKFF